MDGILAGVGALVTINSLLQFSSVLKAGSVERKVDQFVESTETWTKNHEKRISRLEDKQMKD